MKKFTAFFILFSLFLPVLIFAQIRVAVLPFQNMDGDLTLSVLRDRKSVV